jgi:aminopeptidase
MDPELRLRKYAAVLLDVGLELRPGRALAIDAHLEHAPLVRAVAAGAYERGARYVDAWYWDPFLKASRVAQAPAETLAEVPPWLDVRYRDLATAPDGACYLRITGDPDAEVLQGLDPARAALDRMPFVHSRNELQTFGEVEWTIGCYPTPGWAQRIFGSPDPEPLWEAVSRFMRLDRPDPVLAWKERMAELRGRCQALESLQLDSIHFEGPGTDLVVGLRADHRWICAQLESKRGITHVINLPSEEVATSPDPSRVDGTVRSTRPLALGGSLIRDMRLTFAAGRVTGVAASEGAEMIERYVETDPGAERLGEVALVDNLSPLATDGRIYYDTLLDENAACHLAWGSAIPHASSAYQPSKPVPLAELGLNESAIHTDFMVGSPEVTVTGESRDGNRHVILRAGDWVLRPPA